jgi:hypothetical protein
MFAVRQRRDRATLGRAAVTSRRAVYGLILFRGPCPNPHHPPCKVTLTQGGVISRADRVDC